MKDKPMSTTNYSNKNTTWQLNSRFVLTSFVCAALACTSAYAASGKSKRKTAPREEMLTTSPGREARPISTDERIRMINYNPNEVVQIRGAYGFSMIVEFGEDEVISTVSVGDSIAWQIIPKKNMLFLKPQEEKPETNLLVMTNKRIYSFSLLGFKPNGVSDSRLTYRVKFRYPDEEERKMQEAMNLGGMALTKEIRDIPPGGDAVLAKASGSNGSPGSGTSMAPGIPDSAARHRSPTEWNFNYTFKGSVLAAPIQMLDDGEFTYVRFSDTDNVPAIFVVDSENRETLINYRREGKWLVIERIGRKFLFRANNNADVTCVFNESPPDRPASSLRPRKG